MKLMPKQDRVVVEGVNKVKRHVRKTPQRPGQVVEFEAPIHVSNVMLVDPENKKRTRVGYTKSKDGKKQRVAKSSGKTLTAKTKK